MAMMMDPEQFQHLLNMLRGIQICLSGIALSIFFHAVTSGPSTSGIIAAINDHARHTGPKR